MFDLFRSRAKLVRIFLGALLGVMALSMLVYLIPGSGMSTAADDGDQVVAEIGKSEVTVEQVQQQLRNVLQNRQLPPELAATYIPQLVDQAIAERAVSYEAQRLGIKVSDRDLADAVRSFPFATLPPDQYQQYVQQQTGMSVEEFENNVRLQAYENTILNMVQEGDIVTPAEAEAEYKHRNEKIQLDYIGFDPAKMTANMKPSEADLASYFAKNHNFYNVPESRTVQLIVADQAKLADAIQVPDSQVQAYYDAHRDQYRTPARVHARHILLSITNKPKDEVPKIKAQAEDLLKQIKAGGNFAELAKKYSQDPGSAQKGGDLGWVSRGQMVKNFEDAVFALKDNQISDVITTEYGFHIIQVLEHQPAHLQTLDEVKPQILATLRNQSVFDKMQTLTDQAHAELVKAPQNAQQIANQLGLEFVNVPTFTPGSALPELGSDAQLSAAISALKPGEVSQELQSGNKLAVAVVTAVHPPHPAQLSEVESQVRADYLRVNAGQLIKEKADKAEDLLKKNGGDMKAAAKAVGAEVKTTAFFTRSGAAEGIGSASLLVNEFDKPVGTIFGPLVAANQTIVGKIVGHQAADMAQFPSERDAIVLQLKGRNYADRQSLLQDSVLAALIKQGKVKKHEQVIQRLIAQYKS